MQEREAVTRLKRGDISGLEALVRLHQDAALNAAFLVCRDKALAEDLVQAAFVRVYERFSQFDDSRPFAPWFIRAVVNDALKAVSRERSIRLDPDQHDLPSSTNDNPDELLAAAETRGEIWAILDRLSPGQRAVIVLRYYCDLNDSEVASALGIPPGTARRRLHDARERLRALLPAWLRPVT